MRAPIRATEPCQGSGRVSFALRVTISSRFGTQLSMLFLQIPSDGADAAIFFELLYVTPNTVELNVRRAILSQLISFLQPGLKQRLNGAPLPDRESRHHRST